MSSLDGLRAYLLPKTLEHAVRNCAFYAAHLGEAWRDVQTPADLPRLPLLEKSLAVKNQAQMRCGPASLDFGSISSGTTRVGKEIFRVERCPEEDEALAEFFATAEEAEGKQRPAEHEREPEPYVLHILTPNHGLPASAAPANTLRLAWAYSKNVSDMVAEALARDIGGRRITVVRASVSILKQLTVWFLETGVDFSKFAVEMIGSNAAQVTSRWRGLIERTWRARLFDNYSISEIKTPATECSECGWYHFTEPPVIFEVLDAFDGRPLVEGVGQLVLTGLYPYVQRQPLIRYVTGNLVELGPSCDWAAERGLRFVGRRHQTVSAGSTHLLFPTVLLDIADDYSEVARHVHPFELTQKVQAHRIGDPKVRSRLGDDGRTVHVDLGLAFEPRLFPARADALRAELTQRILAASPLLASKVRDGAHRLEVALLSSHLDDWNAWFVKYQL